MDQHHGIDVLVGMTEEDEKALGLAAGTREHHFRLDGGKANYSRATECEWFERHSYEIEQGDQVGVALPWSTAERRGDAGYQGEGDIRD